MSYQGAQLPEHNEQLLLPEYLKREFARHGFESYYADSIVAARLYLTSWLQQRDIHTFIGWPASDIGVAGFAEAVAEVGIQWEVPQKERWWANDYGQPGKDTVALVRAHGAWLRRGALWFPWDNEHPLSVVVLPKQLIVVLFTSDIFFSWDEWLRRWHSSGRTAIPAGFFLSHTKRSYSLSGEPVWGISETTKVHLVLVAS